MDIRTRNRALRSALLVMTAAAWGCGAEHDGQGPVEPVESVEQPIIETRRYAAECTDAYQNNWQGALAGAWTVCDRFVAELDNGSILDFYYDLHGSAWFWHDGGDQEPDGLEEVDLFFTLTHGGAISAADAVWAMWDQNVLATTSNMRLGDEGRGLSILAQDSCETLKIDSNTWDRWDSVFRGGLRGTVGSHGTLNLGSAEFDLGKVFAQRLNAGDTVTTAWFVANDTTAFNNQDTAVMFTGTDWGNCTNRRDTMTWSNFEAYPRLRDNTIGSWCGLIWDDI
ncbi:DUF6345 domain-containing protein [Sorangium sp. So ce269]